MAIGVEHAAGQRPRWGADATWHAELRRVRYKRARASSWLCAHAGRSAGERASVSRPGPGLRPAADQSGRPAHAGVAGYPSALSAEGGRDFAVRQEGKGLDAVLAILRGHGLAACWPAWL